MPEKSYFTLDEKENVLSVYRQLLRNSRPVLRVEDFNRMRRLISEAVETGHYQRNKQGTKNTGMTSPVKPPIFMLHWRTDWDYTP